MKFKVGDKVRVINKDTLPHSKEGIVMEANYSILCDSRDEYKINCYNGIIYNHCKESDLELIVRFKVGDIVKLKDSNDAMTIINYIEDYGQGIDKVRYECKYIERGITNFYRGEQIELIEEKEEMKFKEGDKVKVINKDGNYGCNGSIYRIESNGIGYPLKCHLRLDNGVNTWYYDNNVELIEEKKEMKYITLADIKKCKPCNDAYIRLLEEYGNNIRITYEDLINAYPEHKGWISNHLYEFKEQPVYNGNIKINSEYYIKQVKNMNLSFDKIKVTEIEYSKYAKEFEIIAHFADDVKDVIRLSERITQFFTSLSDLKKHWHHQITAIKDDEEKRNCMTCENRLKDYDEHCIRSGECCKPNYQYWKAKEESLCKKCSLDSFCVLGMRDKIVGCDEFEEKDCGNCNFLRTFSCRFLSPIFTMKDCQNNNYYHWKPKEK